MSGAPQGQRIHKRMPGVTSHGLPPPLSFVYRTGISERYNCLVFRFFSYIVFLPGVIVGMFSYGHAFALPVSGDPHETLSPPALLNDTTLLDQARSPGAGLC